MNILEIFTNSILLIITLDNELWDIILLSLFVSFTALIIASLLGFIVGYYFAIIILFQKNYFDNYKLIDGNSSSCSWFNCLFIFASGGPLGILQLLYTPSAMIIAQTIIIFPIIASLSQRYFLKIGLNLRSDKILKYSFWGSVKLYLTIVIFINNNITICFWKSNFRSWCSYDCGW